MDLTPGPEIFEAVDKNCLDWVRNVTGNPSATTSPLAMERVHEIATLVYGLAYQAGREDAARDHVWAVIFSNYEPEEVDGLYANQADAEARAEELGEGWAAVRRRINLGRRAGREGQDGSQGRCTCPDLDVTTVGERPGTRTVKGLDHRCPEHGQDSSEEQRPYRPRNGVDPAATSEEQR